MLRVSYPASGLQAFLYHVRACTDVRGEPVKGGIGRLQHFGESVTRFCMKAVAPVSPMVPVVVSAWMVQCWLAAFEQLEDKHGRNVGALKAVSMAILASLPDCLQLWMKISTLDDEVRTLQQQCTVSWDAVTVLLQLHILLLTFRCTQSRASQKHGVAALHCPALPAQPTRNDRIRSVFVLSSVVSDLVQECPLAPGLRPPGFGGTSMAGATQCKPAVADSKLRHIKHIYHFLRSKAVPVNPATQTCQVPREASPSLTLKPISALCQAWARTSGTWKRRLAGKLRRASMKLGCSRNSPPP